MDTWETLDASGRGQTWSQWAVTDPTTGPRLAGRYQLLELVGRGSGGEVYRAHDPVEGRDVAVKRFRMEGEGIRGRVRREVAALRLLDLPGVVRILDDGEADGDPFVIMELVEGKPFPGALAELSWETVKGRTLALLEILARVHDAGVVHRDVKPSNVLVRADGRPVLLDFGLARGGGVGSTITRTGAVLGPPATAPPSSSAASARGHGPICTPSPSCSTRRWPTGRPTRPRASRGCAGRGCPRSPSPCTAWWPGSRSR